MRADRKGFAMADNTKKKEVNLNAPLTEDYLKELLDMAGREMFGAQGA